MKTLNYFSVVVLYCLKKLKGERSVAAVHHLLKGKKSSQTIHDGKLYQLSNLFSVLPDHSIHEVTKAVHLLKEQNYIREIENDHYVATIAGEKIVAQYLLESPFPEKLDGWKYNNVASHFWKRLTLIVQVLSNISYKNQQYTPIQTNESVQKWVKDFFNHFQGNKLVLINNIVNELELLLSMLSEKEANLFVLRLSSFDRIGLTYKQLSTMYREDETYIVLTFQAILHEMVNLVEQNKTQVPILAKMIVDINFPYPLTVSARKTLALINNGKSIDQISKIRDLKESTIEDHIVEIAHNIENFSIEPFINTNKVALIQAQIRELQTNQLKLIKQALNSTFSYFEIRLVLAKSGGVNEVGNTIK
ncbi:helix-turn-helix domain-containing protein [Bacillus sp. SM2101]|uniref:helix-turn-helix domain-containing protein n=1 Tax=Bacillus sp. SM2101 TaxID=2805366 RepID=UPI001BDE3224|nr:helix-turn-helix domain-containing protein [Bacillus sp. SM2101]